MSYDFIDVNEVSQAALPAEALLLNGEYIENLISGYRTLSVSGREALSVEIETYSTGVRDGDQIHSKRYPARTIIVKYMLKAASNGAFREAYNQLGKILNVTDAQLIFNDEQDKYFIGTPAAICEVEAGRNTVVGEIEFLCTNPFKYSVVEYEAVPSLDDGSILIDYNGTYKSYPTLQAEFYSETEVADDGVTAGTLTGGGDCGYVAFFNESEKIIQLGDPDEVDGEAVPKSQTLINQTFLSPTAWGTTAKALWAVNNGKIPATVQQLGTVAMKAAAPTDSTSTASTSGTLLNKTKTKYSAPLFYYTVKAKAANRTASGVKVTVTITTALSHSSSYFGRGYGLKASVYIGGAWKTVTLKNTTEYWKGTTAHTANLTVDVTGLAAGTTSLTGIKFKVDRTETTSDSGKAGKLDETACSNLTIPAYSVLDSEDYYLTASSYGTASGAWHGPSITRQIGADAAGEIGASEFRFTYKQKMCIGNGSSDTKQMGGFHVHLNDANGKTIAGVRVVKTAAGKQASLMLFVNGQKVHQVGIDLTYNNKYFGASSTAVQASSITKSQNKVYFNIGGYSKYFTDDAIEGVKVTSVTMMFEQYSSTAALSYNGVFWAKLVKNHCDTYNDIPNKFSANDVVQAVCSSGKVLLNGVDTPDLGALGNDWEDFYLTAGLNQIGFAYSDWVADECAPAFKVKYREVFL